MKTRFRLLYGTIAVCICIFSLLLAGQWTRSLELQRIKNKAGDSLNVYVGDLQSELDKFEALPQILAMNSIFVDLLSRPKESLLLDRVNRELEQINTLAETSDIYLLDADGLTIASSNWQGPVSFIGEDLSFRPYFKQAREGRPGRYFALGTTSKVRGYYFSAPVYSSFSLVGVITVKVQLQRLEGIWAQGSEKIIVTDPDGVIFITSHAPWKFRSLYPLSLEAADILRQNRRYGDIQPDALTGTSISYNKVGSIHLDLKKDAVPQGENKRSSRYPHLLQSQNMPDAGWTVHILSDTSHVDKYVRNMVLLVAFLFVALLLTGMLFYNRRKTRLERVLHEKNSRTLLQQTNEQLEHRVQKRTHELTKAVKKLHEEVSGHKRTEAELRDTQEGLVQAGKLAAIGQMSASIAHEINQPLAAIRMYAENACVFLDKKQPDEAQTNLSNIAELIEKMAEITTHLKSFSRKSPGESVPVLLSRALENSMILLDIQVKKHGALIQYDLPEEDVLVFADPIRLEQVIVNVIGNGLDAISGQEIREISIKVKTRGTSVLFMVHDSGPGIAKEHIDQLFDSFFTTKKDGKGLGLGLSLSLAIIRDFGGFIRAENYSKGGTMVTIGLTRAYLENKEGR